MNRNYFSIILFVVAAYLVSACTKQNASDVNQDKIYQDLQVFYDKNTDKSWVLAQFKFGGATGTYLELDSGATVKFNNDILPYNGLFFGHFKEYAGRITSGTFTYTNMNNQTFVNTLPACDTLGYPASVDTIHKSAAYDLQWTGTALAADESVGLFIGSWTWGQDALYYQDGDGAHNLVLGLGQLSGLPVGPSTLYMDRATTKTLTQKTSVGGTIVNKYRAKNKVIQIAN